MEQGGALTGQDYKLFVRASPANVRQLRAAVVQIDRQPNQLLVSVRRSTQQEMEREGAQVSGTVGNRGGDVSVQATDECARSQGRRRQRASHRRQFGIHQQRQRRSDRHGCGCGGGRRPWAAATTEYRNMSSGFLVTPRLNGQTVVLDIEQQDERVVNGSVQTQHLTTQVSGDTRPMDSARRRQRDGIDSAARHSQPSVLDAAATSD